MGMKKTHTAEEHPSSFQNSGGQMTTTATTTAENHLHEPHSISGISSSSSRALAPPQALMTGLEQTLSADETFLNSLNPFEPPMTNIVSAGSMTSGNWGSPALSPDPQAQMNSAPIIVPSFPPSGVPVVIAASGIRVPGTPDGSPSRSPAPAASKRSKSASPQQQQKESPTHKNRQKRLERNRESARLSRRRRKQYLEVLEERVQQLSLEMDKGRREHVSVAIDTIQQKRYQALQNNDVAELETNLSRTSPELRVAATFQTQQLQSLVFPPHNKFLLWLSLQTDAYFRGGRAASERLSAARIGERMLGNGNDRAPPAHGMWPLLCNEVGLSYDQEERVRTVQRTLVQTPETWLDRHAGSASGLVMQSTHDCIQALHHCVGQRERTLMNILADSQRLKLLQWAASNKERLTLRAKAQEENDGYSLSPANHDAANLYIINHRLQKVLNKLPIPPALVVGSSVKRLSRRPSFESLGSVGALTEKNQDSHCLSRESSFSSSGSLKRSASELEMEDERPHAQTVSPEEAEIAARPTIDAALGFVKDIMPLRSQPQPEHVSSLAMPPPVSQAPEKRHPYQLQMQQQQAVLPGAMHQPPQPSAPVPFGNVTQQQQQQQQQQPMSSFLPRPLSGQPLNAVPEEGFQGNDPADDFLFELAEEDWAIGEGFDMDTI